MKISIYAFLLLMFVGCSSSSSDDDNNSNPNPESEIYFPAIDSDVWDSILPSEIGWDVTQIQPLVDFLEDKNTKGFIMLYDGKIVVEEYMNGHNINSPWYWASAGKTLSATTAGIAEDEGFLNIDNKVSDYLGIGWTSTTIYQENLITCKHLLTMTSGLDDSLGDDVTPENLHYVANAGSRWAYHNVYVKIQDVVASATGDTWNNYFNTKLKNRIGMTGSWVNLGAQKVYWSNTRSMARFGLMIYANGKWDNQQIISGTYLNEATNTSQNINLAYGYLWWLNGKTSYHLPTTQVEFLGELIPNAPADMFVGLGKNDQKLYVVPSKKLVVIRMGETADGDNFGLSTFDNDLWELINIVIE